MRGKMCANVFANDFMVEGMAVNVFETGLNVSADFGQVCYRAQTSWLLK